MKYVNSGYSHHGASRSKPSLMSWISSSKSPHEDISENVELLRERSRDLYAGGGPLGRGAIDRIVLNALGSGLRLNVRIDPERLNMTEEESRRWAADVESQFDFWAGSKRADFTRQLNFYELQVLAFKSVLLDGECLVYLTAKKDRSCRYDTCIQLIESDRLMTPSPRPPGIMIDEGVETDEYGTPLAYWISNRNPKAELQNQPSRVEYTRLAVNKPYSTHRQIIHLMNPERINQHRGVPFLSPVIEQLKQLGRYTDAELMAAVISGMFAVFYEHEFQPEGAIGEESYAAEEGYGEMPGYEEKSQTITPGSVIDLPPGVKATSVSPSRPNTSFEAFVEALVRQIGGCLGIPSELLFLHFTASYSASRGALLEAWKLFRYWRTWFAENFCQPIYEEWLSEAVNSPHVSAPGFYEEDYAQSLYTWSEWVGPSQGQLDPVKEVNAAILRVKNGFNTCQR